MSESAATSASPGATILFIDDEKNVLAAIHRQLRKDFNILPALSGEEGLRAVEKYKPAVVVCDMRMPGMDGASTLAEIERLSPDTVRLMLTGNADQETAVSAINRGKIFRFLNKPCPENMLRQALIDALRQYELVTAEKALLNQTLTGSVRALTDILSLVVPDAFGKSVRVLSLLRTVADKLGLDSRWELDLAGMLYPVGMVSLPPTLLQKIASAKPKLSDNEKAVLAHVPEVGKRLLMHIPRLSRVAEIVLHQDRGYNGSGVPEKGPRGADIPLESRILRAVKDMAEGMERDEPTSTDVERLLSRSEQYDPAILSAIQKTWGAGTAPVQALARRMEISIMLDTLLPNDLLLAPVTLASGKLLLSEGLRITAAQIERLRNFNTLEPVQQPIIVERIVVA